FTRHWESYKGDSSFDGVATVPSGFGLEGSESVAYVNYHNGVSSLKSKNLTASSLNDLSGKSLVAFAGARQIIPGLDGAVNSFSSYSEKTDQIKQSRLLFSGRTDAVLGDALIFFNYNDVLQKESANKKLGFDPHQEVSFSPIFDQTPYHMVFRDSALNDDFNRCFKELDEAGKIQEINKSFVSKYQSLVGSGYLGF
ncbi:MAG: transporter substrate-binding domain-containing protein, partial [Alphaproteobacteria bacterium]|nr:transporter substrate-binding domain-containing protein [Alphaproteobacteria bacterium]